MRMGTRASMKMCLVPKMVLHMVQILWIKFLSWRSCYIWHTSTNAKHHFYKKEILSKFENGINGSFIN